MSLLSVLPLLSPPPPLVELVVLVLTKLVWLVLVSLTTGRVED